MVKGIFRKQDKNNFSCFPLHLLARKKFHFTLSNFFFFRGILLLQSMCNLFSLELLLDVYWAHAMLLFEVEQKFHTKREKKFGNENIKFQKDFIEKYRRRRWKMMRHTPCLFLGCCMAAVAASALFLLIEQLQFWLHQAFTDFMEILRVFLLG